MNSTLDVEAVANAVVTRIQQYTTLVGWPEGKATLSEAETAAYIGIGTDFLRELRSERKISHRKIGRRIVYAAVDIAEFLERNSCRATEDLPQQG